MQSGSAHFSSMVLLLLLLVVLLFNAVEHVNFLFCN